MTRKRKRDDKREGGPAKGGMFAEMLAVVRKIPSGRVATYGQVARAAGFPGAARQVVWALHSASAAALPWHRVVGSGGRVLLGGDAGVEQRRRLRSERVRFSDDKVPMKRYQVPWEST